MALIPDAPNSGLYNGYPKNLLVMAGVIVFFTVLSIVRGRTGRMSRYSLGLSREANPRGFWILIGCMCALALSLVADYFYQTRGGQV